MEDKKIINNRKKPVKTWKKILLFLLAQLLIVSCVLCLYKTVAGGSFRMSTLDGDLYYQAGPFESKENFEESYVFRQMMGAAINDIMVFSVVRSQMETDGVFDGKKEIDITDYVHRRDQGSKESVSAVFRLEDLLKWSKYGLEYETKCVRVDNWYETVGSAESEIAIMIVDSEAYPGQSVSGGNSEDGEGYYVPSVWMEQSMDAMTSYSGITDIFEDEYGYVYANINILKCRYQTVNGKNLEQLVNNWDDYFTLVHNLDLAIANLSINYNNYQYLQELYGEDKSNVKYCILTTSGGSKVQISNLKKFDGQKSNVETITETFQKNYDEYLYYCPAEMEYNTNMPVKEELVFSQMTSNLLEYAYPETTKIWIGVDSAYPVEDDFSNAHRVYESSTLPVVNLLILAGILFMAYFILMLVLCCKAGWESDEEGNTVLYLNLFDRMHTEFVLLLAGFSGWLICMIWYTLLRGWGFIDRIIYMENGTVGFFMVGAAALFSFFLFGCFLLSLVRRIKGKNLLRDTFIGMSYRYIHKKWLESIRENKNHMLRNWGIYVVYLFINGAGLVLVFYWGYFARGKFGAAVLFFLLLLGFDLWIGYLLMRGTNERYEIIQGINRIRDGEIEYQIREETHGENQVLADAVNNIGDGIRKAVETSMKDERLKADLITNVSHDIKTPLTSIINYVDLMKREDIQDDKIKGYIAILDAKSQRLKQLTEDLVEASKISSGNISYVFEKINLTELVNQAVGEFSEKFDSKGLQVIDNLAGQTAYIEADSRRMWRVVENLFNNIYKYALEHTRIYLTMQIESLDDRKQAVLSVKNISAQPLNIDASELTERFIRGDISRSTEGSGLGLSIAKNLTEAQNGKFDIYLDGDLFKVSLTFPLLDV